MNNSTVLNLIKKESLPVAFSSFVIVLGIFLGVIFLFLNRNSIPTKTENPVSFSVAIEPIQKGFNATEVKTASEPSTFYMSNYKFDISNGWVHTKNIQGLKDTKFISNIVEFDSNALTNGDSAVVYYINKGDYTFYISNQFITESNIFYQDGINYTEDISTNFGSGNLTLSYSTAFIVNSDGSDSKVWKQIFACPYEYKNICFASGYLPLVPSENTNAVQAFKDFIKSIAIHAQ